MGTMQFYTNDWLTVYRKDFQKYPVEATPEKVGLSQDPVLASFSHPQYLKVDNCKHIPSHEPSETKSDFLKRTRSFNSFRLPVSKESKKGNRTMSSVSFSSTIRNNKQLLKTPTKTNINPSKPALCYCWHCRYSRLWDSSNCRALNTNKVNQIVLKFFYRVLFCGTDTKGGYSNPDLADKYYKKKLDDNVLCRNYDRNLLSLYQRDICHEGNIVQKGKRSASMAHIILPDEWYYPVTSHTYSYRNPKILIDVDVRGRNMKKHEKDAFVFSDEMQKIMKINTGKTVYRKDISDLGKFVIDYAMHGEINK